MTGERYSLDGLANPDTLDLLHDLLDEVRAHHPELDEEDVSALETAIVEITGNLVRHSLQDPPPRYRLRLLVLGDRLQAELTHPDEVTLPDPGSADPLASSLDESGRGLALAKALLHRLDYRFEEGRSVWLLERCRRDAAG